MYPSSNASCSCSVAFWDFEDGQLPTDITMRVEDSAENHPNAGDEFNEDGFGIFNLQHYLLGTRALAINTWFTDPSKTADRWVVLPRMKVTATPTLPCRPFRTEVATVRTDSTSGCLQATTSGTATLPYSAYQMYRSQ